MWCMDEIDITDRDFQKKIFGRDGYQNHLSMDVVLKPCTPKNSKTTRPGQCTANYDSKSSLAKRLKKSE